MSDLFKSAIGYFSNNNTGVPDNDFVGQEVDIGNVKLRVKRVIAEGKISFHTLTFTTLDAFSIELFSKLCSVLLYFILFYRLNVSTLRLCNCMGSEMSNIFVKNLWLCL